MAYTKKRVVQHIMGDRSIRIVQELLPHEWVVREYKPDYGIDLSVELFEFIDEERAIAATLGETLFVQVKSTDVVNAARTRVHARRNVELGPLQRDRSESTEIEVVHLQIETSELLTIQAIGSAIPILLFLVELSTKRIYYVCLNDLIEKVILPEDPDYGSKGTKLIHIPFRNCISTESPLSVLPLLTYAKRPKLYAAFAKFAYQKHQLEFWQGAFDGSASETQQTKDADEVFGLIRHFLSIILRYDFWTRMPEWAPIRWSHEELQALQSFVQTPGAHQDLQGLHDCLRTAPGNRLGKEHALSLSDAQSHFYMQVLSIWSRLDNLSRMYEELAREWFLPTYLSTLLSGDLRGK